MADKELETLLSMKDQLDPKDAEVIMALATKYGVLPETAEAVQTEAPVIAEGQPATLPAETEQPVLPATETPVEAVQMEEAPALPVMEEQAVLEQPPVETMPTPSPTEEVKLMVSDLGNQLVSLKNEIEALKATLEKVAVREPVSEEEANIMEAQKQNVGQRIKGQPSNIPDKNVMNDLIKKLGGLSK
jgi:hypothetical protein